MKILLVEDNLGDARLLQEILREFDCLQIEWLHARTLVEAGQFISQKKIDLILLDLSLPDSQGYETFASIQGFAESTAVIVLTGLEDETLADKLATIGAQDYLIKGNFDAKQLIRSIRYAIERKRIEEKLQLAAKVIESTLEAIIVADASFYILSVNKAFAAMTNYSPQEVQGQLLSCIISDEQRIEFFRVISEALNEKGQWQGEVWNRRKDGEKFPAWMSVSSVRSYDNSLIGHYVAVFTEITHLKKTEERLQHIAYHDALTGLPNRILFHDRLTQAILAAHRNDSSLAVMFLDLDRFKIINDTLGHHIADQLLKEVANRLRSCVRETDTAARLSGDEFAIILNNLTQKQDAELVAINILDSLSRPIVLNDNEVFITSSIGIAVYSRGDFDKDRLLENADIAMYHAKDMGRNNFQFYSVDMNILSFERLQLETDLRRALDLQQFELHYQPQVDINSGQIVGVEALLRWKHSARGEVAPSEFIPILEQTGLIEEVGEWVLRTACRQCRTWLDFGFPEMRMAVNLSPRQLKQRNLIDLVADILQETQLNPEYLELEVTESMIMDRSEETVRILTGLKKLGVKISLGDFGAGVSAMSYLNNNLIDSIKICRSFVLNMDTDENDQAIAASIITLANNLKMNSIAEGVETNEQLNFFRAQHCNEMQGFLFSRPLPEKELTRVLQEKALAIRGSNPAEPSEFFKSV